MIEHVFVANVLIHALAPVVHWRYVMFSIIFQFVAVHRDILAVRTLLVFQSEKRFHLLTMKIIVRHRLAVPTVNVYRNRIARSALVYPPILVVRHHVVPNVLVYLIVLCKRLVSIRNASIHVPAFADLTLTVTL